MPTGQFTYFRPDSYQAQEIIDLYNSGLSVPQIITKLGLEHTQKTLQRWLKEQGIILRRAGVTSKQCIACCNTFLTTTGQHDLCQTCAPDSTWTQRYYNHKITKPQFDEMLEKQSGLCDLCGQDLPERLYDIKIDHCHTQGHVRGLIHAKCNTGLHYLEDDKFVAQAFRYIEKHKK